MSKRPAFTFLAQFQSFYADPSRGKHEQSAHVKITLLDVEDIKRGSQEVSGNESKLELRQVVLKVEFAISRKLAGSLSCRTLS